MPYYIGVNNGGGAMGDVTANTSTTSKDVEVVINTNANVPSVEELLLAIEKIENYILTAGKAWS